MGIKNFLFLNFHYWNWHHEGIFKALLIFTFILLYIEAVILFFEALTQPGAVTFEKRNKLFFYSLFFSHNWNDAILNFNLLEILNLFQAALLSSTHKSDPVTISTIFSRTADIAFIPFFPFQNPNKPSAHIQAYGSGSPVVTYLFRRGISFNTYTTNTLNSALGRIC